MGPYGHEEAGGTDFAATVEAMLLAPYRHLSLFTVHQPRRDCISATLVLFWVTLYHFIFYFKLYLPILELCSIQLKIIRFYSEHFIA